MARPQKEIKNKAKAPPRNGIYYTVPEAVEVTGLSKHTIQARLRDGTIKGKKLSNEWRIYAEELEPKQ